MNPYTLNVELNSDWLDTHELSKIGLAINEALRDMGYEIQGAGTTMYDDRNVRSIQYNKVQK